GARDHYFLPSTCNFYHSSGGLETAVQRTGGPSRRRTQKLGLILRGPISGERPSLLGALAKVASPNQSIAAAQPWWPELVDLPRSRLRQSSVMMLLFRHAGFFPCVRGCFCRHFVLLRRAGGRA